MGKVRAKTLGDEEQELKEKQEAEARRLAKIEAEKAAGQARKSSGTKAIDDNAETEVKAEEKAEVAAEKNPEATEEVKEEKPAKKKFQKAGKTRERSENYQKPASQIEKGKASKLTDALALVEKTHLAKFDETVELHINTTGAVSGSVTLPHGTGKSTRVAILAPSKDEKAAEILLKEIESGKINFDILVATPDAMPKLAKVARILGPRGLMPNPKNGTVTPNPDAVAKQYEGGHMTFKTEAKAPVLHLAVGKLSFGTEKLEENIKAAFKAVEAKNMKKIFLKSTMSPSILIQG